MKKEVLVLLLLLSIIDNAKSKLNILAQVDDDINSLADIETLKGEATRSIRKLFGFNYVFTNNLFDREIVIYSGVLKIKAKLSYSCTTTIPTVYKTGEYQIRNGVVVSQKGVNLNLSSSSILSLGKMLQFDFKTMTTSLTTKLKGSVVDGTVKFSFTQSKIMIQIIYSRSQGKTSCDGSLTITIEPGNVPRAKPQLVISDETIQESINFVAEAGTAAIITVVVYKLAKGLVGYIFGGPVGFLLGAAA
jgi:hypothetical protein